MNNELRRGILLIAVSIGGLLMLAAVITVIAIGP